MRRGHVLLIGTLVMAAVTAGTVMHLARGGSSAPRAETTSTKTIGAWGGYCFEYPYGDGRAPDGSLVIVSDGADCHPGLGLGNGPIKVVRRKTHAATAAPTGDGYCIQDTEDNGTWHYLISGYGDFGSKLLKGPCPG